MAGRKRQLTGARSEAAPESLRCAVYTRKSTTEGLSQEFNSLDAQREACEAYIASQRAEGWTCLPGLYDDGGYTGGNMDRPALKRLMADIEAGKVDCIVVYKVDRLSRSLMDFARIVEALDRNHVSFVSITQQFNTTTSMGRLTLNILLSFAQFEREIISERTRDKMSAARRKGKWIGGMPILGYDVDPDGGRLLVNEDEADRVRAIFDLYLETRSVMATVEEVNRRRWTTKAWTTKKGRERQGRRFDKSSIYRLLSNVAYTGKVAFEGEVLEGEHEAIIEEPTWRRAQALRNGNGKTGGARVRNKHGAMLRGLLLCTPCGAPMLHSFTKKGNRLYRYYVCQKAQKEGWDACPSKSVPAAEIERFVLDRLRCIGRDPGLVAATIHEARKEGAKRLADLQREEGILTRELKKHNAAILHLVEQAAQNGGCETPTNARLADLHERIRYAEQRAGGIRAEILALEDRQVDEADLAATLARFDPIWETLTVREQARVFQLLVERVGYDGTKGSLAITFRPSGVRTLAAESRKGGQA